MAYVFLNDGGPEAEEYESNYYHFNPANTAAMAAIEKMLASNVARDADFRAEMDRICRASFQHPPKNRPDKGLKSWAWGIKRLFVGSAAC